MFQVGTFLQIDCGGDRWGVGYSLVRDRWIQASGVLIGSGLAKDERTKSVRYREKGQDI